MKLDGELLPGDRALDLDGWRTPANQDIASTSDFDLAHWCAGKQIVVTLPSHFYPQDAPHTWTARVIKVANNTKNTPTSVLAMLVAFSAPISQVSTPADKTFHTQARLVPLPVTPLL